jgi:hypothetical protein
VQAPNHNIRKSRYSNALKTRFSTGRLATEGAWVG